MEHSKVYRCIRYFLALKDASPTLRSQMISNMTRIQMEAFMEVVSRFLNGILSPLRRDATLIRRKRTVLRTLISPRVSLVRKKALLRRHHSFLPRLLRTIYLIQVILDERQRTRED